MNVNRNLSLQWLSTLSLYTQHLVKETLYGPSPSNTDLYGQPSSEGDDLYGDDDGLYGPSTPETEHTVPSKTEPTAPFEICINNESKEFSFRQLSPEDKLYRKLSIHEILEISEKCLNLYDREDLKSLKREIKRLNINLPLLPIEQKKLESLIKTIKCTPAYSEKPVHMDIHQKITAGLKELTFYSEMLDQNSIAAWLMNQKRDEYQKSFNKLTDLGKGNDHVYFYLDTLNARISGDLNLFETREISVVATLLEQNVRETTLSTIRELKEDLIPRLEAKINQLRNATWFSESFEIYKLLNSCKSEIGKLETNFKLVIGSQVEICSKISSYQKKASEAVRFADEVIAFIQYNKEAICAERLEIYTDLLNLKLTLDEFMKRIGEFDRSENRSDASSQIKNPVILNPHRIREELQELMGLPLGSMTYGKVKEEYRKWIFKNHPDKTTDADAAEKSKKVIENFQLLTQSCKDTASNELI